MQEGVRSSQRRKVRVISKMTGYAPAEAFSARLKVRRRRPHHR